MKQADTTTRSRRAVLAAAVSAAAATAVASLSRPLSAAADDGDPLIIGQANVAQTGTSLQGDLSLTGTLEFDEPPARGQQSIRPSHICRGPEPRRGGCQ